MIDSQGLKGSDKTLFDLCHAKWPCRFLPVLVVDEELKAVDEMEPSYENFFRNVFSFTKQDLEYLNVSNEESFAWFNKDFDCC